MNYILSSKPELKFRLLLPIMIFGLRQNAQIQQEADRRKNVHEQDILVAGYVTWNLKSKRSLFFGEEICCFFGDVTCNLNS